MYVHMCESVHVCMCMSVYLFTCVSVCVWCVYECEEVSVCMCTSAFSMESKMIYIHIYDMSMDYLYETHM